MTGRGINWILLVKCVWITANLCIWVLGLGSCITEPNCWLAINGLFPFLFLLSFPSSLLLLIGNELLLENGIFLDLSPAMHYTLLSLGALLVGYIQWFHVIPTLFGKQQITMLSLNQRSATSTSEHQTPPKRPGMAQVRRPQVQPFDNAGHSPLERVINRKSRRQPTNVS